MLARDIMIPDVIVVEADATLAEAARLMLRHGINGMPVVDAAGKVAGMIGIKDILRAPAPSGSDTWINRWTSLEDKAESLKRTPVRQVMARHVYAVTEHTPLVEVMARMTNWGTHPIPVLRHGRAVGIIGRADAARLLLAMANDEEVDPLLGEACDGAAS